MKKLVALITAASLAISSLAAVSADDDIKVLLDGEPVSFDVPPQIVEDRTLVPFRAIFEALGYEVFWDEPTQKVSGMKPVEKSDFNYLVMHIGSTEATISNLFDSNLETGQKTITLDVPPQIIDGRTLVPVRAVGEMSGYEVDWIDETRTVTIVSPEEATKEPDETAEPEATDVPEEVKTPEPTEVPKEVDLPITFDDDSQVGAESIKNFELLAVQKREDGKYDITFTLETFMEGTGNVEVWYNCLNAKGEVIDKFGNRYKTTAYTWTTQNDKATISGNTVKIVLAN